LAFFSRHADEREKAFLKGAWNTVIRHAEAELKNDPENIQALNDLAFAFYKKADYDRAYEICQRIYQLYPYPDLKVQMREVGPRYMRYHEVLAEMYYLHARYREALDICERLKTLDPLFSRKYVIASQVYMRWGDLEAAAKELASMAVQCPKHTKEAFNRLFDLIRQEPLDEGPPQVLYALYIQHGKLEDVIARYEALCASDKADDLAFYILAYMYHFSKELEKESDLIRRQMVVHPNDPRLFVFLARNYYARQAFSRAMSSMERAIALAPGDDTRYRKIRDAMFAGEQEARQHLEEQIEANVQSGHLHDAMQGYEQLLSQYPDHKPYHIGLAKVLDAAIGKAIIRRDFDEAISLLDIMSYFKDEDAEVQARFLQRKAQLAPILPAQEEV